MRIFQSNHSIIIGHAKNQRTSPPVCEGGNALAPAFRLVYLKLLFLVVIGSLSDYMYEVYHLLIENLVAKLAKIIHKILIYRIKLMKMAKLSNDTFVLIPI